MKSGKKLMPLKKKKLYCCKGEYHILIDGKYYCMAPPDIECEQLLKDAGKFTRGEKKIRYCKHFDKPCSDCDVAKKASGDEGD